MTKRYNVALFVSGAWVRGECSPKAYDSYFATSDPQQTLVVFKPNFDILPSINGENFENICNGNLPEAIMVKPVIGMIISEIDVGIIKG